MPDGPLVAKIGTIVKAEPVLQFGKTNSKPYAKFSLAVTPSVPEGQEKQPAQYYEVIAFDSLAEHIAESLHKGYRVLVIGTGKTDVWTGKDGKERTTKTILADAVGPDLRFVNAIVGLDLHPDEKVEQTPFAEYSEESF